MSGPGANAGVSVNFTANGVDAVRRNIESVGEAGEGMAHHFEHAGISIAFAVQALTDGTETGVHRALHAIAQLGFAFGPEVGGITLAVALATNEMIKYFAKTREEAEKTEKAFKESVDKMVDAGDKMAIRGKLAEKWLGTPAEIAAGKKGLGELERDLAAAQQRLGEATKSGVFGAWAQASGEVQRLKKEIGPLREEFDKLVEAMNAPMPFTSRPLDAITSTAIGPKAEEEARKQARKKELERLVEHHGEIMKEMTAQFRDIYDAQMKALADAADGELAFNEQRSDRKQKEYDDNLARYNRFLAEIDEAGTRAEQRKADREAQEADREKAAGEQHGREMVNAVSEAFVQLLQSGGNIKKSTDFILEQMGGMFVQIGEGWVAAALAFKLFGGPGGLASGLALIAVGAAMGSVASHDRSSGSGGGFGGYAGAGSSSHYYGSINPAGGASAAIGSAAAKLSPVAPVVVNAMIIGKDDPQAQRQLLEMIARGQRRGSTSG